MAIQKGDELCLSWSEDPNNEEYWDSTIFTWSDCILIQAALPAPTGGGGTSTYKPNLKPWVSGSLKDLEKRDQQRKKRLIQLITFVKEDRILEEKEIQDISISVSDIVMVKQEMEKRLNIKIDS
jgi:hypothetical protein